MTALLLFVILSYASALNFQLIQMEIRRNVAQLTNGQDQIKPGYFLLIIKRRHLISCETVDFINNFSGSTLLFSTLSFWVSVINSSFCTFDPISLANLSFFPDLLFLLYAIFNLTWICFTADRIRNKVNDLTNLSKFICVDQVSFHRLLM